MPDITQKLGKAWSQTSPLVRALLTAALILVVGGSIFLLRLSPNRDDYVVAFSDLELTDAGEIITILDEQRVPYRLADDSTAILVPEEQVHHVRLQIAAEGLPKGSSIGFELMDNLKLGATEFERRINYVRALQGELVQTITQLNPVEAARVHIALPEPSLFIKDRSAATAAVFLQLVPGTQLSTDEVRGIKHLIASSIENLSPEEVTVVDTTGQLLTASPANAENTHEDPQTNLGIQETFETRLQQSVQSLLEQVFGPGEVVVRVNAELDFDQKVIERELLEPLADTEGLVTSLEQLDETFVGNSAGELPASGSDANIPGYQASTETDNTSNYSRTEVSKQYSFNQTREQLVVAPGTVDRLSVAVMVNQELTAAQQNAISEAVAASIGADAARNDQITVLGMPFDNTLSAKIDELFAEEPADEEAVRVKGLPVWAYGAAALALLAAGILFLRHRHHTLELPQEAGADDKPGPKDAQPRRVDEVARKLSHMGNRSTGPTTQSQIELKRLASQQPEHVARVIRTWLDSTND